MKIEELLKRFGQCSQVGALANVLNKKSVRTVFLDRLVCSSAPLVFAALSSNTQHPSPILFILQDADEAGYFYHDLVQL